VGCRAEDDWESCACHHHQSRAVCWKAVLARSGMRWCCHQTWAMGQPLQCATPPQRPKGLPLGEVSAAPPLNTAACLSCCSSEDELYGTYGLAHMDHPLLGCGVACGVPLHCPDSPGASEPFLGQCDECELEGEYLVRQVRSREKAVPFQAGGWGVRCVRCVLTFVYAIAARVATRPGHQGSALIATKGRGEPA
jgi:hypothetical protein